MKTFTYKTRVFFKDTDAGGVVYHGNYLYLCEQARTFWHKELFPDYSNRKMLADGEAFMVCGAELKYMRPALLDDEISIECSVMEIGSAFMLFRQEFKRGDELLTVVKIKVVVVNTANGRPQRMTPEMRDKYSEYMYEGEDK